MYLGSSASPSPPRSSLVFKPKPSALDSEVEDSLSTPEAPCSPSSRPRRMVTYHFLAQVYQVGINSSNRFFCFMLVLIL